jgi:hypothetical protein
MIGGGLKLAGSIAGGIAQAKAYKKVQGNLNEQREANQNWYDRRYNEDATQRADAQAVLAQTEESIKARNKMAAGAQAVMGGTDESVAAEKERNNAALAQTTSKIAAMAENRKDSIESQYLTKDEALQNQSNDLTLKRAEKAAETMKGVADIGSEMAKL